MTRSQLTKEKLNSLHRTKKVNLVIGTFVAVFIAITPYIYYLYQGIPDIPVWDSFFGTITSNYYESVQVMGYILMGKIIPIFLLLIWFFTCKHWWYHALLIPIIMFIFQAYTVVNADLAFSDSNEFFVLAPFVFIMLIFSYTVRTRIFDKIHGIDLSELSRVNWKGELKKEYETDEDEKSDDEVDDEMFMSY